MLTEPIVEGAYYEREDGVFKAARVIGHPDRSVLGGELYWSSGANWLFGTPRLTRRVWLVPTDPADVVAELRRISDRIDGCRHVDDMLSLGQIQGLDQAVDVVVEKLGVGNG